MPEELRPMETNNSLVKENKESTLTMTADGQTDGHDRITERGQRNGEPFHNSEGNGGLRVNPTSSVSVYIHQNSQNEEREEQELGGVVNQSFTPVDRDHQRVSRTEGTNMMKNHVVYIGGGRTNTVLRSDVLSRNCVMDTTMEKPSSKQRVWSRCFQFTVMVVISSIISSAIVAPLILALVRSSSESLKEIPNWRSEQNNPNISKSDALIRENPDRTIIGSFVPDQDLLYRDKVLRWNNSLYANTQYMVASDTDSCVKVMEAGIYEVVSQITFQPSSDTSILAHTLLTKGQDGEEEAVQKKLISVPARIQSLEKEAYKLPSNLIAFADMKSGDELCTRLSPLEQVYASTLDNALTIIRL
ncbi:hypothetical protein MAR_013534 [Mya arenaria]|uniref:TNF family profile domain-containing protein n=1 Tax=Mya arenaria TaxID=6604 RepID=A0ABY7G084_MYAAR|nr:uncharacterized protein LOC128220458 [Mya arenaria]WAR27830.1 hypothetical protein MAR_013534 [Mya arenaria]